MFENRKLKKIMKRELCPDRSFDEFCRGRDITVSERRRERKAVGFGWLKYVAAALVFVLIPAFAIGYIFNPSAKHYKDDNVVFQNMSYEQLIDESVVLPYNMNNVFSDIITFRIVVKDNNRLVLGYKVDNIIYAFNENEKQYAFSLSVIIRKNKAYSFVNSELYKNLTGAIQINEMGYTYGFSADSSRAYIKTVGDGCENFIEVTDFEGETEVNEENIKLLIEHLL